MNTAGAQSGHTAPAEVANLGRGIVEAVDMTAIAALLTALPTAPLLQALDAVMQAMDAGDEARSRQRAGLVGRLLGRDLVAQADPDPPDTRLRVELVRAQDGAKELAGYIARLEQAGKALDAQCGQLTAVIESQRTDAQDTAAHEGITRRLIHLETIVQSWRSTGVQIETTIRFAQGVLERHEQVRDVLAPLWRRNQAAAVMNREVLGEDARRLEETREAVRHHLGVLCAADPSYSSTDPADRKPTP